MLVALHDGEYGGKLELEASNTRRPGSLSRGPCIKGSRSAFPTRWEDYVLLIALEFLSPPSAQARGTDIQTTIPVSGQVVTEEDAVISSGVTIVVETRDGSRRGRATR